MSCWTADSGASRAVDLITPGVSEEYDDLWVSGGGLRFAGARSCRDFGSIESCVT